MGNITNEEPGMSTMKPYDSNQTALDMAISRDRTSITVEAVRNFLHRELLLENSR